MGKVQLQFFLYIFHLEWTATWYNSQIAFHILKKRIFLDITLNDFLSLSTILRCLFNSQHSGVRLSLIVSPWAEWWSYSSQAPSQFSFWDFSERGVSFAVGLACSSRQSGVVRRHFHLTFYIHLVHRLVF